MRRIKYLIAFLVIVAAWFLIAPSIAANLILERPLAHADAIIVLSGSAAYKERTKKAAELYREGVATLVVITNDGERAGWSQTEQRNIPYVELEQRGLIANGVMPDAIVILSDVVAGTDQEAQAVAAQVDRLQIRSLLIVTSPYHTRRALRIFEKVLAEKNLEIGVVHTPRDDDSPDPRYWWLSVSGWRIVTGEYVKSAVYWLYY